MNQEEITKRIGIIIRQLREQKRLSQAKLCKEDIAGNICSVKTLRRIEHGERETSFSTIYALLAVLGTGIDEFNLLLYGADMRRFNSDFSVIWDLGYAGDYRAVEARLEELKGKSYCNHSIPVIKQALLLCESTLLWGYKKDYPTCFATLCEALNITIPHVLSADGTIHTDIVSTSTFNINEYRIPPVYKKATILATN